jgi:hypothetical protein
MKTIARGRDPATRKAGKLRGLRRCLQGACLATGLALLCSCGALRPPPPVFEAQDYTPIDYQELLHPGRAGLHDGQRVRVKAFFWQLLDYDPAMVRNYLGLARHPLSWSKLRWFAVYGSETLQGYYDLAAVDESRLKLLQPKRLEAILLYGQLSSLGPGFYLHVHHLEKAVED